MGFFNAARMALRHANDDDFGEYVYNQKMHDIRVELEIIDEYLGGRFWEGFREHAFIDGLNGGDAVVVGGAYPDHESKRAVGRAWRDDDLYGSVLSGDAGVLEELWETDPETVEWFRVLVQGLLSDSEPPKYVWDDLRSRKLNWSGYENYGTSWTED